MNIELETIEMLKVIKANSYSITTVDGRPAVAIEDCSLDSFLWVMNQAIAQIKDGNQTGGITNGT